MLYSYKIKEETVRNLMNNNNLNFSKLGQLKIHNNVDSIVKDRLKLYTIDGKLDAQRLTNDWFPEIKANVFISHSHNDEQLAYNLAGIFESRNIKCFLDSCVWKHADDLLKAIDDEFCKNDGEKSYSYNKRNYSTSHVHIMLATAIMKMIYNCECVIFLDTPNSITPKQVIPNKDCLDEETVSPWIFLELELLQFLKTRSLEAMRRSLEAFSQIQESSRDSFEVSYKTNVSQLKEIKYNTLQEIISKKNLQNYEFLDCLYKMMGEKGELKNVL